MIERSALSLIHPPPAHWSAAFLLLVGVAALSAQHAASESASTGQMTNPSYRLEPLAGGAVRVHAGPVHADFAPAFTV